MDETRPLVTRTEVTRSGLLKSRPVPGADVATVFLDKHGKLHHRDRLLTAGESAWATPRALFEVDTAVHVMTFELQLPAVEEAFSFSAKLVVHWRIDDPVEAVKSNLAEPELLIKPHVEGQLRTISRRYPIERSADAEDASRRSFASGPVRLAQGIVLVQCGITLRLDKSTQGHIAARTHAERKRERLQDDHETTQLTTRLTIEQANVNQLLEQQRAMFAQQMAEQEERHKLSVERMKMDFYSQALSEGNLNLIALRLSTNREDVNDVIGLFMRQREVDYEGARGLLKSLLDSRLMNKRDVADIMAGATAVVSDHMTRTPFGMDWTTQSAAALEARPAAAAIAAASPVIVPNQKADEDDDDLDDDFDDDDD